MIDVFSGAFAAFAIAGLQLGCASTPPKFYGDENIVSSGSGSSKYRNPGSGQTKPSFNFSEDEFRRFIGMTRKEALRRYGKTVEGYFGKDVSFILAPRGKEHPFRADLVSVVSSKVGDLRKTAVRVIEMTWVVDEYRLITIWFTRSGKEDVYAHHIVWNRFWNFDAECPEDRLSGRELEECRMGHSTNYYDGITFSN